MKPLIAIWDPHVFEWRDYWIRHTARAVLLREDGKVPLLYVWKFEYHKLPWWGIDEDEDVEKALRRECFEELGAEIEIGKYIGEVVEYRAGIEDYNVWIFIKQVSHCYVGKILSFQKAQMTPEEISDEFEIHWFTLNEAIRILETEVPKGEEGIFIKKRELAFLREVSWI